MWSLETFEEIASDEIDEADSFALTPDGKHCVYSSEGRGLSMWGIEEKKTVASVNGEPSRIHRLAVTKDRKHCFSGAESGSVKIWSLEPLSLLISFPTTGKACMELVISPDNRFCTSQ